MRLGMILPMTEDNGRPLTQRSLAEGARKIEAWGFDSAWVFDAIGRGAALPDPLIALAVAGAVTRDIELGTCILQVPLRRPVELAHRVLTAHLVCGGRLLLGVGAGSTRGDFDAVGVDYESRHRDLREALDVMQRLWAGEQVGPARLDPWPVTVGGPPVLIGSWAGSTWVPRAAREHQGWIASAAKTTTSALAEGIHRYRDAGGTRAVVTNVVASFGAGERAPVGPNDPFSLVCSLEESKERLVMLRELGFDDVVLFPQGDLAAFAENVEYLVAMKDDEDKSIDGRSAVRKSR